MRKNQRTKYWFRTHEMRFLIFVAIRINEHIKHGISTSIQFGFSLFLYFHSDFIAFRLVFICAMVLSLKIRNKKYKIDHFSMRSCLHKHKHTLCLILVGLLLSVFRCFQIKIDFYVRTNNSFSFFCLALSCRLVTPIFYS